MKAALARGLLVVFFGIFMGNFEYKYKALQSSVTEQYVRQTLYGVIPMDMWNHYKNRGLDPFQSLSECDARILKRKFRKLKRKARVKKGDSTILMWNKIERYLRTNIPQ